VGLGKEVGGVCVGQSGADSEAEPNGKEAA
jgi:hypothetical protein